MVTKYKICFLTISFISFCIIYQGCDGIFPSQTKPTVPADHTDNITGAFHKPEPQNTEECTECHGSNLRGGTVNIEGQWVFVNSCYECHADLWTGRGGNGGGTHKMKIK